MPTYANRTSEDESKAGGIEGYQPMAGVDRPAKCQLLFVGERVEPLRLHLGDDSGLLLADVLGC